MGERSAIEWTDGTFNPWWGCICVSPGCEHCYAETFAKRVGQKVWGPAKTTGRRLFGEKHWREPVKWNAKAWETYGRPMRVFCASMADVFEEHPALDAERAKLWALIEQTPNIEWQILTKRPENALRMAPWAQGEWPRNVWLGVSVEDQTRAEERIPALLDVNPCTAFLSCEPLLGPLNLKEWIDCIEWVIIGGESGPGARPFQVIWARSIIAQCREGNAAPFVKQLGAFPIAPPEDWIGRRITAPRATKRGLEERVGLRLNDAKGGDISEWPEDLRVREMPTTNANGGAA